MNDMATATTAQPAGAKKAAEAKAANDPQTGNGKDGSFARSTIRSDIEGALELDKNGEFRIHGDVKGNLASRALTIRKTGSMKGEVHAKQVRIEGAFTGKMETDDLVISKSAHVDGEFIVRTSVVIEPGADFKGTCRRVER